MYVHCSCTINTCVQLNIVYIHVFMGYIICKHAFATHVLYLHTKI